MKLFPLKERQMRHKWWNFQWLRYLKICYVHWGILRTDKMVKCLTFWRWLPWKQNGSSLHHHPVLTTHYNLLTAVWSRPCFRYQLREICNDILQVRTFILTYMLEWRASHKFPNDQAALILTFIEECCIQPRMAFAVSATKVTSWKKTTTKKHIRLSVIMIPHKVYRSKFWN